MTHTPTLNGQDIGAAESAVRAVLNRLLARTGTPFHGWVILNLLGRSDAPLSQDELTGRVVHGLKIGGDVVHAAAAGLAEQGLISREPQAGGGRGWPSRRPARPASGRSRTLSGRSPRACTVTCPRRTWPPRTACWPP